MDASHPSADGVDRADDVDRVDGADDVDLADAANDDAAPGDLSAHEVRVLGCLIEKESTTPDSYPLTVNSLRNACNQSTSRDPVMSLTDHDVDKALASLRDRGLTRTVHSTSNRATKYRHVAPEALSLEPAELAVVAVLLLRGEQTVGELKSRSERQHSFESVDEVAAVLESLSARSEPFVRQLERRRGQKDARWIHLLGDTAATGDAGDDGAHEPAEGAADIDVDGSDDPYGQATAEFYDLLATGEWDDFGLQLIDLLADIDVTAGPVIDLGSGTGIGLAGIALAAPGAHIHAIEPSKAMRVALHTRLMMDPELRAITTVDPRPWGSARLPRQASAIVASALLGHLDGAERTRLWRYVAEQMPVGAPAVIQLLPPARPVVVPLTRYRSVDVGEFVYEGWQSGEPVDDHHMRWTLTYAVKHGDETIVEYVVRSGWRCIGADDVRAEIEPHGLTLAEHGDVVVVRRAG